MARGLCSVHYFRSRYQPHPWEIKGCSKPGCTAKHRANGLCVQHYKAQYRDDLRSGKRQVQQTSSRACEVPGCQAAHLAKGLCEKHYQRAQSGTGSRVVECAFFADDREARSGINWDLEKQATQLLLDDREVSGPSYDPDWLTPAQLKGLNFREVYHSEGPEIFKEGNALRASNPLFGTRPKHLNRQINKHG
jgi:hypothetical protein